MKIKKGDNVLITKGKDRGRTGRVLRSLPKEKRVIVEGIGLVKKRVRPQQRGEKGKTVEVPSPVPVSNLKLVCSSCKKGVRVGFKTEQGKKTRICKKCGKEI